MHKHDDKYPTRPGFEPGTYRLQALVNTNEPSGLASIISNLINPRDKLHSVISNLIGLVLRGGGLQSQVTQYPQNANLISLSVKLPSILRMLTS